MDSIEFKKVIRTSEQLTSTIEWLVQHAKQQAIAGTPLTVTIKHSKQQRSIEQNAKLHALCNFASKNLEYPSGFQRTTEEWKRIFVSGFVIATEGRAQAMQGLEGEFLSLCPPTSTMSIKRMGQLLEYVEAYLCDKGLPSDEKEF